jgi:hypothetical protein
VTIDDDGTVLRSGQVGWLDRPNGAGAGALRIVAGDEGARLVLYSGQPQGDRIISYGPFIGDSKEDIARLFSEYHAGKFPRMADLTRQSRQNRIA